MKRIRITEVGPRDGLQNECAVVGVEDKVAFIDLLSGSGAAEVEVSSFVSPRWVPQLGDAEAVFARLERVRGVVYSALVPNEQGMARALEAGVKQVAFDRREYKYHGRVATLADAARDAGLDLGAKKEVPLKEKPKAKKKKTPAKKEKEPAKKDKATPKKEKGVAKKKKAGGKKK